MPHQSSQLTEDTEVGEEKKRGRGGEGGREDGKEKRGKKDVWSDTKRNRKVKEIKDTAQRERHEETWRRKRADTVTQKYFTNGKVNCKNIVVYCSFPVNLKLILIILTHGLSACFTV